MLKNNMLLNQKWKDLLKSTDVVVKHISYSHYSWDETASYRFQTQKEYVLFEPDYYYDAAVADLQCCGISELNFQQLQDLYSSKYFEEIVAKHLGTIVNGLNDNRVLLVGMPTKVGDSSMYNIKFYRKLRKILLSFGFVELVDKPYKNGNSGNKVTVLACKIPRMKKSDFDYIQKEANE
jgi:hypothetical protein